MDFNMTTLKPEQKDILEKLNEIALEANWGTTERVNSVPKAVAVIKEAMEEIKRLRELHSVIANELNNMVIGFRETMGGYPKGSVAERYYLALLQVLEHIADSVGVTLYSDSSGLIN